MKNAILIGVLLLIVASVAVYLILAKRKGKACVGCPCSHQCKGSCHVTDEKKEQRSEE